MSQMIDSHVEYVATELLNRTVSYRRKLRYSYHHRNIRGIPRAGYPHLWRIDLDDLDAHLIHIAWRIAHWTTTQTTIKDQHHLTMGALKFYLKELTALFRSQRIPKWMFHPIGINQRTNDYENYDLSKSSDWLAVTHVRV